MNIPKRFLKTLTVAVLVGLVVFSVLALALKVFYSGFEPTPYITAISLLAIAVLTIVYSLMASDQLEVLKGQLSEMQETRKLDSQPLSVVELSNVFIEPPSVFYDSSEDEHLFHARVRVNFSIRNHTSHPAVNVVAAGVLALNGSKKPTFIRSMPTQLDILGGGRVYKAEDEVKEPYFMFSADKRNDILSRFRKKTPSLLPILQTHIMYRNVLGACFSVDVAYRLVPGQQEDREIIDKWQELIVSFPVEHQDKLEKMRSLKREKKETQWKRQRTMLQNEIEEDAGEEDLEVSWERIPNSFKVKSISMDEYTEELKTIGVSVQKEE